MSLFRRRPRHGAPRTATPAPQRQHPPSRAFGFKCGWLAVRADDHHVVAGALGRGAAEVVDWSSSVIEEHATLLVTPPVDGWVLVVCVDIEAIEALDLDALSRRFGEAQRFGSHRVVDFCLWERWRDGRQLRRMQYVGEQGTWDESGQPDDDEQALNLRYEDEDLDDDELAFPNEEHVTDMAGAWSVDPLTLDDRDDLADVALLLR